MNRETNIDQQYVVEYRKKLGAQLKEARGEKTLQEIADAVGMTVPTISRIENGKFPSPIDLYIKIAVVLNLKISLK